MERAVSLIGVFVMIGLAWLMSPHKRQVSWRVVGGGLLLRFGPQGREIVLLVAHEPVVRQGVFLLSVLTWALSIWFCARTLCDRPFERDAATSTLRWRESLAEYLPRLLGGLAFVMVALAFYDIASIYDVAARREDVSFAPRTLSAISLFLGVVFYLWAWQRRKRSCR